MIARVVGIIYFAAPDTPAVADQLDRIGREDDVLRDCIRGKVDLYVPSSELEFATVRICEDLSVRV